MGSFGKVQLNVVDQYNNIALSENRKLEATASGNAIGASVVNVRMGSAYFYLTNQVAETVTIGLTDTFATGLDVSSTIPLTFASGFFFFFFLKI